MVSEAKGLMYVPVWVDGGVVKALVTNDGNLPVSVSSVLSSIQAQAYGYDGAAWKKQGMIWAYKDRLAQLKTHTAESNTTLSMLFTAVPSNEVHRITGFSFVSTGATTTCLSYVIFSEQSFVVYPTQSINADVNVVVSPVNLILKEGDRMYLEWGGLQTDDFIVGRIWGSIMHVAM